MKKEEKEVKQDQYPNKRRSNGKLILNRCFFCVKDNHPLVAITGICSKCGWEEGKK
jgi:hypothetical protein